MKLQTVNKLSLKVFLVLGLVPRELDLKGFRARLFSRTLHAALTVAVLRYKGICM